jgi:membrane-bound lytic murein transglycosylase D
MSNRASIMDSCTRRYLPSGVMVAKADSTKTDSLGGNGSFPYVLASNVQNVSDDENYDEDGEEEVVQRSRTKRVSYTVRRGDNVTGIARKYGVSVAAVRKWNHIRRNNIRRGQRLVIYKEVKVTTPATRIAVKARPQQDEEQLAKQQRHTRKRYHIAKQQRHTRKRYHTVQKGDTLWIISQRYGLEIGQLKKRNKIRGNSIKPGQKLIIST